LHEQPVLDYLRNGLDEQRALGDELRCSDARFLRNAIAKEAATPSSFEARTASIRTRTPVVS
jgi:hypothetical protein